MKRILLIAFMFVSVSGYSQQSRAALSTRINNAIYTNTTKKITGDTLNHILNAIVNSDCNSVDEGCGGGTIDTTHFWNTNGNAGTDPAANFIGTTDAIPLMFRVNNEWFGKLQSDSDIVAIGKYSSQNNTGTGILSIGSGSAIGNSGSDIVAIGTQSAQGNTACCVTAIGGGSAVSNAGDNLVAIGINSANSNKGVFVTIVGASAGVIDSVDNATAIGANSLIGVSNGISLGDTTKTPLVGIGTAFPRATLQIGNETDNDATLRYIDGNQGSNKVLTSDANGLASWQDLLSGQDTLTAGVDTVFNSEVTATSIILLTGANLNGSSQTGHLDVVEISAGNWFVVNSLKINTTLETSDNRQYNWYIVKK